jgi:hypothetical protein
MMGYLELVALVLLVIAGVVSPFIYRRRDQQRIETTLSRPADITVTLLARNMPALVAKAQPFVRQDYGGVGLSPEFDGEIRYFIEQVILADPDYIRPRVPRWQSTQLRRRASWGRHQARFVQIVRSTIAAAIADPAEASQADAIAKEVISRG